MCEFIGIYEDSKLLKRRSDKSAEEEEPELEKSRRATHSDIEVKYRRRLKNVYFFPFFILNTNAF